MASYILHLPFRRTHSVTLSDAIKQYISSKYDQHPDMFTSDLDAIDALRAGAIHAVEPHHSGVRKLLAYAAQLVWIGGKFPVDMGVDFSWFPALGYNTQRPVLENNVRFELANVLFNLAAMYSQLATSTNRTTTDGLKQACNQFCLAAGVLSHLKVHVVPDMRSSPPEDMDAMTLESLEHLMLAQAQECFWQKAVKDGLKDASISKLAAKVSDLYSDASDWGIKSDAVSMLGDLSGLKNRVTEDLKRAEKDNDMIYLQPVPPKPELKTLDRATMVAAKTPKEVSDPLSMLGDSGDLGRPLFSKLVPYSVHIAASIYADRRDRLVAKTIDELEGLTARIHDDQIVQGKIKDSENPDLLKETSRFEREYPMQNIEAVQFEDLFEQRLHKYDSDDEMVAEEDQEQQDMTQRLEAANAAFVSARRGDSSTRQREQALQQLENAYFKYKEIISNLDVGRKFYNDLSKICGRFRGDCRNFAYQRRAEATQFEK
ncbi:putative ph-response regulator protein pala rim20 [Diplodia seriata]|uniref:Putative ph-response regulator protein pala rim20 n=1 Tax=Diplodia seriata TaxID=420778 RepID=A0A0G2H2D8_9PEZI|nr:putative ph-response regulator protein pala rim20 [Diplodia seriata]